MSIHNILISRTSDGLLLTANTDTRGCSDPEELKKSFNQAKLLARISARIPDRATYVMDQFAIQWVIGVIIQEFWYCSCIVFEICFCEVKLKFTRFHQKTKNIHKMHWKTPIIIIKKRKKIILSTWELSSC